MHLRQVKHFLAVVDHGSLGAAAAIVNISEPALSKSIRRLEDELGVRLFDRGTRGMVSNAFGEALAAHARIVASELGNAMTEIEELRGMSKGVVRVGTQPSATGWLLARAIRRLREISPGVRASVFEGTVDLVNKVLAGELDFILVALSSMPPDPSLVQEHLCDYAAAVIGAPGSLAACDVPPSLERLAAQEWVVPRRPDPLRLKFDEMFTAQGLAPPEITVETASAAMIRAMVIDAGCLSFMPVDLFHDEIAAGQIVCMGGEAHVWQRQIGIVRRRRAALSPAARSLVRCLREEVLHPRPRPARVPSG